MRAGKFLRRFPHQGRIAHSSGANNDAGDPLRQPAFDGRVIADAATELHRNSHRAEDALDGRGVHRPPGKGAVEVDDMEIVEALRDEGARLLGRITMKSRRARHVALFETDSFTVFQIDRRKEDHGFHVRKLAISARPSFWLFSG